MAEFGVDHINTVEVYGVETLRPQQMISRGLNPHIPYVLVTGRRFERTLRRQNGMHDTVMQQIIGEDVVYEHAILLPPEATVNMQSLRDAIINQPPPVDEGQDPDPEGWIRVANTLSNFAAERGAINGAPLGIIGDEAFGRIKILHNDIVGWGGQPWAPDFYEANIHFTECSICSFELPGTEAEYSQDVVGFPCQRVGHRECVDQHIWKNKVYNINNNYFQARCPICRNKIC